MPNRDILAFINESVELFGLPPDATKTNIPKERPKQQPTLSQAPPRDVPQMTLGEPVERRMFGTQYKNENSPFWLLPEEEQRRYVSDASVLSPVALEEKYGPIVKKYLEWAPPHISGKYNKYSLADQPPWLPTGKLSGIGENISAGLTSRTPRPVPASDPLSNAIARLFGEGAKYATLASSGLGIPGAALASGGARVAQAEDNEQLLEGVTEMATAPLMAIGGAAKAGRVAKMADEVSVVKKPWQMTRADFVSARGSDKTSATIWKGSFERGKPGVDVVRHPGFGSDAGVVTDHSMKDYTSIIYRDNAGNVVGEFKIFTPDGKIETRASHGSLLQMWVDEGFRRKGIATKLREKAKELFPGLDRVETDYTQSGAAFAHKNIVKNAIMEGKPVPAEVLADYPDLLSKNNFLAPLVSTTKEEAVTLASFGYTPEGAAALQQAWETKVINPMAEAIKRYTPEKIKEHVNKVFGGRTSDPNLAPILTERELDMQTAQVVSKDIIGGIESNVVDALAASTGRPKDAIRKQVFKFLDPTVSPDNSLGDIPPMYRAWMDRARDMLDEYSQQLVDLGIGPTEAIEQNIGQYMKRYYKDKNLVDAWRESSRNWFKSGMKDIKARKLRSPEDYAKRKELGLVEDYRYAFSRTIGEQAYNVSVFNAYRKIAANEAWASANEIPKWKLIPNDPKKYGDLAGKWMRPDVFDNVQEMRFFADRGTYGRLYDKLLASWKFGKTALSPATHGRNIMSNAILADFGGLSPLDIPTYTKALNQYFRKGRFYREALEDGLLGSDWYGYEIGNYLGNVKKGGSIFDIAFDRVRRGKFGRAIEKAGAMYQGEEHFFKLALYMKSRADGMSRAAAAAHAQKHLFDYSDLSPFLQRLRRSPFGGPFLAFTAKSVPVMVEAAAKHPWRVGKYYAMFEGMNAYSKATLGLSEEEYREYMDALPPWQRNGMTLLLPFRDSEGRPVAVDATYNMPWGDLTETGNLLPRMGVDIPVVGPLIERFVGSNPAITIPAGLALNRDPFTGKEIVDDYGRQSTGTGVDERIEGYNIPGLDRADEKRLSFLFKQLAPGVAVSGVAAADAILDGKTRDGKNVSVPIVLLNKLAGIKFVSIDKELSRDILDGQYYKIMQRLRSEYAKYELDESKTDEEKADILRKIEEAYDAAAAEYDKQQSGKERDTTNLPPPETFDFMKK